MTPLNPDQALKLSVLIAALAAITIEDIMAIKAAGVLGDDQVLNIQNLQTLTTSIDAETIQILNDARVEAGLPTL
jgi:hypothetical protein